MSFTQNRRSGIHVGLLHVVSQEAGDEAVYGPQGRTDVASSATARLMVTG